MVGGLWKFTSNKMKLYPEFTTLFNKKKITKYFKNQTVYVIYIFSTNVVNKILGENTIFVLTF